MNKARQPQGGLRTTRLRARQLNPRRWLAASAAQRAKVVGRCCAVCERSPVDPAHLVPQRLGGCPHPDCVIALCRTHHRLYDSARLTLMPYLGTGEFARELDHARIHVGSNELHLALSGRGWPAPWLEQPKTKEAVK